MHAVGEPRRRGRTGGAPRPRPLLAGALGLVLAGAAGALGAAVPEAAARRFEEGLRHFEEARGIEEARPSAREEISRDYLAAAEAFVEAWELGARTTECATNAGNAFHFAGRPGESVLWWRRALALDPGNDRAARALEAARARHPLRPPEGSAGDLLGALFFWHHERLFLVRRIAVQVLFPAAWVLFAVELLRRRGRVLRWILLALVAPAALGAALLGYLFGLRRPYALVGAFCLAGALAALGSLGVEAWTRRPGSDVVVLVAVRGRNGDGTIYRTSHSRPFPPGTEAEVLERRGEPPDAWLHVSLRDGSTSWLPARAVESVIPPRS